VAEAKAKIDAIAERLAQGEAFADLAKEASQDPGSAENGGDLGFFGRGVMDPAFEAASFSLQAGEVSEPVRSSFGFHLIKVAEVKSGDVKPFVEAKAEVEREYRKAEGERLYFEMAEQMADLSYEDPTSLEPVADAMGLKLQLSDWVTRDQAEGVLSSPKVTGAAFSEDVLQEGNNSELIELDSESAIVLRVVEHEETSIEPMADVKGRIVQILLQQNAENQAKAEAEKRKAELSGSDLTQVAASYPVTGPVTIGRNDRSVPFELSGAVFSSEKPVAGGATPGVVRLANGDHAVYALTSVEEGQSDAGDAEMQARNLRNEIQRGHYSSLVADLESQADIEILLKQASE
jgi:peptidyl-prolyl cis-trans isomerase D